MSDRYIIGIDPGLSGGMTCLDGLGNIVKMTAMPVIKVGTKMKLDPVGVIAWLRGCFTEEYVRIVAIEEQRPMHKQGVTSTFSTGRSYGLLEGIVAALDLPYMLVQPKDWQNNMFKGQPKGQGKTMSIRIAKQLYPKESFLKTPKCSTVHDGLTDATLIAEYARRVTK